MNSVIVYRNPVEAMIWEGIMRGDFVPIGMGLLVFFFSFLVLNRMLEKPITWIQRKYFRNALKTYRNPMPMYVSMAIAIILGCATIWRMWL